MADAESTQTLSSLITGQPAAPKNPYDDAANEVMSGQSAVIRNNVYNAIPQNAAQVSEHAQLAGQLNIPVQSVQSDPMTAKQRAAMQNMDVQKVVTNHPHLADFMTDPTNAAQVTSNGDVPNMANMEQSVKNVPPPAGASAPPNLESTGAKISNWMSKNANSVPDLPLNTAQGLGGAFNQAARAVNIGLGAFPTIFDKATGLITGSPVSSASDYWFKHMVANLDKNASAFDVGPDATSLQKLTHGVGGFVGTLSQIGATGGMNEAPAAAEAAAPVLSAISDAVAHATKSMAFPSITGAINTGNDVYQNTGSATAAVKAAVAAYGTNTAMGVLPLSVEGSLATRVATGVPVGALTGEVNRRITNASMPGDMQQNASVEDTIINGLTGAMLAGTMGHNTPLHEQAVQDAYQKARQSYEAVQGGEALQQLSSAAANTQLRTNNPQAFHDFVQKVTDDGHLPEVYVDGQTFVNALHQSGVPLEELQAKMPQLSSQLQEALHTNGEVKIDTADYATHIAGTSLDAAILPHLKTDPEGMTYAQGQEHLANQQAEMTQQAQEVASKQQAQTERDAQLASITADTRAQFDATGRFPSDVTARYADLRTRFIDTQAHSTGISPEEVNKMMPLKVTGETLGGDHFNQPDLTDGSNEHVIQATAARRAELTKEERDEIDATQHRFLSNFPTAIKYGHDSAFVRRLRAASDDAALDIGGNPAEPRQVTRPLGPFSGYSTEGRVIKGESPSQDKLEVHVYGKEQAEQGLTDTPALKFTVNKQGELIVNGPDYHSPDMDKFVENGWADHVRNKAGETQWGWTHLLNPNDPHGALPRSQVADLLADVHARQHSWAGQEYMGLHWTRATGATGGEEGRESAMYGQPDVEGGNRGFYNPATGELGLLKNADLSTALHELGHHFLESMQTLAEHPAASEGIKNDFDTLLQHFKVSGETPDDRMLDWSTRDLEAKRDGHEQFATDFEKYLFEGKAPVPELQSMFSRFRSWLMNVYGSMKADLSPEVKSVFDRMFASQEAIAEAERVRGYLAPDLSAEHGEQIDQYKTLGKEATEQAIADMQARSLRDMKWMSNAKSGAMKDLQREAKTQREEIRGEVTREVMKQPVYRAWQFLTMKGHESTQAFPEAKVADDPNLVNPTRDSLFEAIAKLGGLRGDEVKSKWGINRKEIDPVGFNKPVVRAEGGKSIDRMAEALVEHHYLSDHDLSEFEEKFGNEFRGDKEYSWQYDRPAPLNDRPAPLNPETQQHGKLSTEDLRHMYGTDKNAAWRKLSDRNMTSDAVGIDPELVAEMHGFNSAREMVDTLASAETPYQAIKGITDQRMLERHGELVDPVSIERAAEAAIHNEVRAKMMATGLKMFTKSPMSVLEINKAAKAAADTAIAEKQVGELRPAQYSAAESKANKELLKLAPKDPQGAAAAQRAALLNNRLFKSASEAVTDVQKGLQYLKRFSKDSVRAKIDVDIRDQIDDILSRFDLRKNPTDTPTRGQRNLQEWVDSQVAAGLMPTVTDDMLTPSFRKPYREMSVEQFRGMVDTIRSMEETGKNRNSILINGEKADLGDYVNTQLVPKIQAAGEHFSPEELNYRPEDRGLSKFQVGLDHAMSWLRGVGAELKPQEFKRNYFDRHEIMGPFGESIFEPVMKANYDKVDKLKAMSESFKAKADELGKDWQKSLNDMVLNNTLEDKIVTEQTGTQTMMKISRGRMIMMALHSGNESNFDKLTKGYGWNGSDVWNFLGAHMTAKDIEAVNHIHEMYETHWPDMVKMYRDLGQTAPPKIEARPTDLPNGRLTGGYAHIDYDPLRSRYGQKAGEGQAKEIAEKGVSVGDYFKRTGTTNGAMNKRIEGYTDAINLDFHTIEQAIKETIHDLSYRRALVDTNKILEHPDFKREFKAAYGPENLQALHTWLGRIANSNNADLNASKLSKVLQYSRTGMVMNAIALRATTVLKHGGSAAIKTVGYMAGGGEKYFSSRFASMFHDYSNQTQGAIAKFDEIRARSMQQDRDYRATASSLFEPESLQSKAERFGHAAVAFSDLFTAVPTAWASYDRAVTEGIPVKQGGTGEPMTEAQAVAYANKMVREAHGSNIESARSNVMTEPNEAIKMFTTLYGFMNNTYGQQADVASKLRTPGISKPEVLARTFMALIVPALWAGYLNDQKKDGESWSGWVAKSMAGEVAGSVPIVRDAAAMVQGYSHAGQVGVESWMQTMVQAGHDAVKAAQGQGGTGKPILDTANALGEGLHIPGLGQIGKSAQYEYDLHHGKVAQPAGTARDNEVVNALVGAPKK